VRGTQTKATLQSCWSISSVSHVHKAVRWGLAEGRRASSLLVKKTLRAAICCFIVNFSVTSSKLLFVWA
jgi:hypothetical protein